MQPCLFCSGDKSAPDHDERCDGRQGAREDEYNWTPPIDPESPSLDGVPEPDIDAIIGSVTPEMVRVFVGLLSVAPRHADEIRRGLCEYVWFPATQKRDTQLRRMRTLRDAAIAYGHPVCTTNYGYYLGDRAAMLDSARRARRYADGAVHRAILIERLAERMTA